MATALEAALQNQAYWQNWQKTSPHTGFNANALQRNQAQANAQVMALQGSSSYGSGTAYGGQQYNVDLLKQIAESQYKGQLASAEELEKGMTGLVGEADKYGAQIGAVASELQAKIGSLYGTARGDIGAGYTEGKAAIGLARGELTKGMEDVTKLIEEMDQYIKDYENSGATDARYMVNLARSFLGQVTDAHFSQVRNLMQEQGIRGGSIKNTVKAMSSDYFKQMVQTVPQYQKMAMENQQWATGQRLATKQWGGDMQAKLRAYIADTYGQESALAQWQASQLAGLAGSQAQAETGVAGIKATGLTNAYQAKADALKQQVIAGSQLKGLEAQGVDYSNLADFTTRLALINQMGKSKTSESTSKSNIGLIASPEWNYWDLAGLQNKWALSDPVLYGQNVKKYSNALAGNSITM